MAVGIVTTVGCPYCKKAKAALKEKSIGYEEAELSGARDVLGKVKEFTGSRTVPQIFIGGEYIGGASELLSLMDSGSLQSKIDAGSGTAFPAGLSDEIQEAVKKMGAAAAAPAAEATPAEKRLAKLGEAIEKGCVRADAKRGKAIVKCVTGASIMQLLKDQQAADSDPTSVEDTAAELLKAHIIAPLVPPGDVPPQTDPVFTPGNAEYFQVVKEAFKGNPPSFGDPMNTHYQWVGSARDAVTVSGVLRGQILGLYDSHLSADGRAVDYVEMAKDAKFQEYVDATAELQRVDVSIMSREERMAFFINIYNALIVHGTVAFGAPDKLLKRLKFFGACKYVIDGQVYSADDCEHGVLRDNAPSPASVGSLLGLPFLKPLQFHKGDPRIKQTVSPKDPRIHFALVCGAKSCPPIKLYTPDNLNEGLQDAAVAFCEGEVEVDESANKVTLSKIFKWYGGDFAKEEGDKLLKIAQFCDEEKKAAIERIVAGTKLSVEYKEYNWSSNKK